jgi:tetratricopeptide (TPR) repeat protein
LLEGASLRDYYGHLRSVGFTEDSILHKVNDSLSDKDLDEKIQAGVPIDYSLQKKLYHEINGKTKVHSILAKLGMQKTLWAPILFNLMTCELVSLESGKAKKNELDTDSIQIDQALVKEAARNLYRPETGILSYPLILYFLERELARHKIGSSQFSVVVFEIKNKSDPLSNVALQQMAECFDSIKQKFDMLGHFMILEFLIVLPLRSDEEAREFVNNLYAKILQCQLDGVKQPGDLSFVAGVANVPSDQSEMRNLLAAARGAKESCSVSKSLCRTVRESKWEKSREQGDLALAEHKVSEAENHWTQALTEARAFGNDDLRLILSLEQLAGIYMQRGKHAKAESLLSQLIQLKGRRKDANGLDVAQAVGELARCYYLEGKYAEAEPLLLKVVEVYEQHLGKDNPTVATGLYNLASIYHVQQKHSEAETAYKRALELRQNALGANHPDTKKVETNYLNLLKHKDEGNPEVSFITGTWKALDLANNVPADSKEKQSTEEANDESAVNQ